MENGPGKAECDFSTLELCKVLKGGDRGSGSDSSACSLSGLENIMSPVIFCLGLRFLTCKWQWEC